MPQIKPWEYLENDLGRDPIDLMLIRHYRRRTMQNGKDDKIMQEESYKGLRMATSMTKEDYYGRRMATLMARVGL